MNNDSGSRVLAIIGGVLVAVGVLAVIAFVLGPIAHVLLWIVGITWPIALVVLGVLLLTRGHRVAAPAAAAPGGSVKRLYRSRNDRMIGGVLAGLGEYLGIDATIVRIAYAVIAVMTGVGPCVVLYIVAMIVLPEAPVSAPGSVVGWSSANVAPGAPPVPPAPPVPSAPPAPGSSAGN